jgi:hypothetical protein
VLHDKYLARGIVISKDMIFIDLRRMESHVIPPNYLRVILVKFGQNPSSGLKIVVTRNCGQRLTSDTLP